MHRILYGGGAEQAHVLLILVEAVVVSQVVMRTPQAVCIRLVVVPEFVELAEQGFEHIVSFRTRPRSELRSLLLEEVDVQRHG